MADIVRTTAETPRRRRSVIADFARSIEISVKQLGLRAKFTAAIADAEKAERAAERLRATAIQSADIAETVPLVPTIPIRSKSCRDVLSYANDCDRRDTLPNQLVEELYVACNWLMTTQNSRSKQVDGHDRESAIAARIAELHDRLGGLIK
jgi:hypothetical protein